MGKSKAPKPTSVPNKHLHSRISYLYQAATYLSTVQTEENQPTKVSTSTTEPSHAGGEQLHTKATESSNNDNQDAHLNTHQNKNVPFSRLLLSQLHDVTLKGQVRLSQEMKRTICRRCYTLLAPGQSSTTRIENPSRGGNKPWADVLVIRCDACGAEKRFPVGMKRQLSRSKRATTEVPVVESLGGS